MTRPLCKCLHIVHYVHAGDVRATQPVAVLCTSQRVFKKAQTNHSPELKQIIRKLLSASGGRAARRSGVDAAAWP